MIEATAARGYAETSVAELCRLAGVSKRTFYEQFENKDACFLASYDTVVASAMERIAAQGAEPGWEATLSCALAALAEAVADRPSAARLALVEALCVGPAALTRRDRASSELERMLAASFEEACPGATLPRAVAKGIVCGIERTVRRCLCDGEIEELPELARALAEWALSYGSPALAALPSVPRAPGGGPSSPQPLPRARRGSECARIVRAAAEIVAGEGYPRLTACKIARRAGISEGAFWETYESTEECYLDALDLVCVEAVLSAGSTARCAADPLAAVYRGLAALLEQIARDPLLRGVAFVEVLVAGPMAVALSERMLDRLTSLLTRELAPSQWPEGVAAEASAGALWGLMSHHVLRGELDLLPGLAGHAAYLALAPLVGAEAAVQVVAAEQRAVAPRAARLRA